ncbi:hypothetical protein [Ammoniphilus resinae]|uniref:TolA-binding protein n=1 Tax=Ammoniphilus resinae TaxID=861532 RepID=A0ABS4GU23_9BACL|nr:hypothetical protein [Ammoniphilus resinae]MBP1933744.1 TolA-binding protein [Ammoniphilus resinae]
MRKIWLGFLTFLVVSTLLVGCGQEKVMDTDFIRLQNKVNDLENHQKQMEEERTLLNQKVTDMEESLNQQKEQLAKMQGPTSENSEQLHPVVIQDVKLTSEKMDSLGRVWGPFNLNITLYNGTDHDISDYVNALVLKENTQTPTEAPNIKELGQRFEIKAKESKIITFSDIEIGDPSKRFNIVIKLLEQQPETGNIGVPGKVTWTEVPSIVFPPKK